jgi:endonuclease/exonuclease/phosphatase family metal-dependent hydrolase
MKRCLLLFIFLPFLGFAQAELNVMTFNIRFNNPADSLNAWTYRKDKVASQILFSQAHIIGVQEALHGQLADMQQSLRQYKYVGVGREGGMKGEFSAIFFDTTRLKLLNSATFWLSEYPDSTGLKGWDAALPRIVTWAKFSDSKTGKQFFVFNTHFDHMGKVARAESARLILRKVKQIAGDVPSIITGDFNAQPQEEPIQILLDKTNSDHLADAKHISAEPHYGPDGTFNGFQQKEIHEQPIDYILIKGNIRVLQHATLSQSWRGRFSSDHFPVLARLQF